MALASVALAGCASKQLDDKRLMIVEGEVKQVQVQDLRSFQVEIAPRKAVCELTNNLVKPCKQNAYNIAVLLIVILMC